MSRIYFHTKNHPDVEVSGREAHLLHYLDKQIGIGLLYTKLSGYSFEEIPFNTWIKIKGHEHELLKCHLNSEEVSDIILTLEVSMFNDSSYIKYKDNWLKSWAWFLSMNSIYGSDVMKLIGQMSAQMEIYAHVRRENFQWFTDLIKKGLEQQILREGMGWNDVIQICDLTDVDLMVMSYSVCEGFPNAGLVGLDPDVFYDLLPNEQWDLCTENLDPGCEITLESIERTYE
jgi:hypothetical protein